MNTRGNRNGNHAGNQASPRAGAHVKTRKPKRRGVPEPERRAVAAEIRALLQAEDETGRRLWTQTSLGERCGGVSQQMIYLAQEPDGVGPSVRDGLLEFSGLTMRQLLEKHGQLGRGSTAKSYGAASGYERGQRAGLRPQERHGARDLEAPLDVLAPFRRAVEALCEDGFPKAAVQSIVAELAFGANAGQSPGPAAGRDALDIYRNARARLERPSAGKTNRGRSAPRKSD